MYMKDGCVKRAKNSKYHINIKIKPDKFLKKKLILKTGRCN